MENPRKLNFKRVIKIGIPSILIMIFSWHIIFTFSIIDQFKDNDLLESDNNVDEIQISINRLTNLVNVKIPLPPEIEDDNIFGNFGAALGEMLIQNIGPSMIEREFNVLARKRFNIYAMIIPFKLTIESIPASPEAVEQARIDHQKRIERIEKEREEALAELQRERDERERIQAEKEAVINREKTRYINSQISLDNVRAGQGERFGRSLDAVFGTVVNNGNRVLNRVTVTVYFLDDQNRRISEKSYNPVLVSSFNFGDNTPLRPGYERDFGFSVEDDAPSRWSKQIEARVTQIEFAD